MWGAWPARRNRVDSSHHRVVWVTAQGAVTSRPPLPLANDDTHPLITAVRCSHRRAMRRAHCAPRLLLPPSHPSSHARHDRRCSRRCSCAAAHCRRCAAARAYMLAARVPAAPWLYARSATRAVRLYAAAAAAAYTSLGISAHPLAFGLSGASIEHAALPRTRYLRRTPSLASHSRRPLCAMLHA